jgi:hypothetical protein
MRRQIFVYNSLRGSGYFSFKRPNYAPLLKGSSQDYCQHQGAIPRRRSLTMTIYDASEPHDQRAMEQSTYRPKGTTGRRKLSNRTQ